MEGTISHLRWHRQRLSSTLTILTNHFLSGGKWSRTRRRCGTNPLEFLECLAAPFEFGRGGNVLLQQAHHLCRDGFSMRASALPKGLVKIVRNVFDIQRCHWITPRVPLDYPRYMLACPRKRRLRCLPLRSNVWNLRETRTNVQPDT